MSMESKPHRRKAANAAWYSSRTMPKPPSFAGYTAIQTSRLYEQIVQQIEDSIMKGTLKPGDQLPAERELAQQFGVSRTAVREAVKALREKGLEIGRASCRERV